MKKLFVLIAACAALVSCSDVENARKHREEKKIAASTKKVRAKYMSYYAGKCVVSRITSVLTVDTIYNVGDTIIQDSQFYVITK